MLAPYPPHMAKILLEMPPKIFNLCADSTIIDSAGTLDFFLIL